MVSWSWISQKKIEGEGLEDFLKQVIESPLWVLVRDFLTSADVLEMRPTGLKWNISSLFGSFAELWFFLMKEEANDKSEPLPERPGLTFDYWQIFGFDLRVFGPIFSPATADTSSRE